jgi:SAM-dependent methyltransferase
VDGYEVDDDAREFSQRSFSNGHIQFYGADITDARFASAFGRLYDWVVMVDVIEHIEDDNAAVANCAKLLAPGGTFACSTPNRLSRYRMSDNHVREYAPNELHILLKRCFDRVEICNYKGDLAISKYENPIMAICKNEVAK